MIDLIRDGVHAAELKARGDRAVFTALVRTAASAQLRGWSDLEWQHLVLEPKSRLGRQASLRRGEKPKKPLVVIKMLDDAWNTAWEWRTTQPEAWTPDEARVEAQRRASQILAATGDPDAALRDSDRAILEHACRQAIERGMTRVALSWRDIVAVTGVGERSVKNGLRRLIDAGWLTLDVRGVAAVDPGRRKATLYSLPASLPLYAGEPGLWDPLSQTYGTPHENGPLGPPHRSMGPPAQPPTRENPDMSSLNLTLDPEERRAVLAVLADIAEKRAVQAPAGVRHLRTVNNDDTAHVKEQ